MPKQKLQNLMTELHDAFGNDTPSESQKQLLESLETHIHEFNDDAPIDPTPLETVELLLEQLGEEHPKTTAVLTEFLAVLRG